jgi:hypothetical protein
MLSLNRHMWSALAAFVILATNTATAQTVSSSFEELRQALKKGQTVVVTDTSGRRTKGKWGALTLTEDTVREIRATDPVRNGALIGAAVGTGLATWDYFIDPSEPGNGVIFTVAIGLGAAIGAGIDALVNRGGKLVYTAPRQTRRLTISPIVGRHRQGALVSVRF